MLRKWKTPGKKSSLYDLCSTDSQGLSCAAQKHSCSHSLLNSHISRQLPLQVSPWKQNKWPQDLYALPSFQLCSGLCYERMGRAKKFVFKTKIN